MTIKEVFFGIIFPTFCAIAGLSPWFLSESKRRSRVSRRLILKQMESSDYLEKKQRSMAIRIAIILYAAGCYMLCSLGPVRFVMIARFAFGVCLCICGLGALTDSPVINSYGVALRRKALEAEEKREAQRRELER